MLVNIQMEEEDYKKIMKIIGSGRSKNLYEKVKDIKLTPADAKVNQADTLTTARAIRTDRIKAKIKSTLQELQQEEKPLTKYQIHIRTKIAYITLNKYFNEILEEVADER